MVLSDPDSGFLPRLLSPGDSDRDFPPCYQSTAYADFGGGNHREKYSKRRPSVCSQFANNCWKKLSGRQKGIFGWIEFQMIFSTWYTSMAWTTTNYHFGFPMVVGTMICLGNCSKMISKTSRLLDIRILNSIFKYSTSLWFLQAGSIWRQNWYSHIREKSCYPRDKFLL